MYQVGVSETEIVYHGENGSPDLKLPGGRRGRGQAPYFTDLLDKRAQVSSAPIFTISPFGKTASLFPFRCDPNWPAAYITLGENIWRHSISKIYMCIHGLPWSLPLSHREKKYPKWKLKLQIRERFHQKTILETTLWGRKMWGLKKRVDLKKF